MFLRRHPLTFLPYIALFIILAAIPIIGYYFATEKVLSFWATESGYALIVMGLSAWYLFTLLLLFTNFVDFFLDIWIVTNERILDIEQKGLFARVINEARLYRVQNVRIKIEGIAPTLFHFGDLIIETAGETGRLVFDNIPDPNTVARRIMELVEADRKYHGDKMKMMDLTDRPRIVEDK